MQFVRHSDAKSFRARVDHFLLRNEIVHNIILGITSRMLHQDEAYEEVFLAHIEDDTGDIIAVTMRTVPHGAILSEILNKDAIPLFVNAYAEVYSSLPSVEGMTEDSSQFAALWKQRYGQGYFTLMELGQYRLDKVIPPINVSGVVRLATQDDFELLVKWLMCFSDETGLGGLTRDEAEKNIQRKLDHPILDGIRIWMDEGQPVSMAAATRESGNGGNVSLVYTPPEFRGRGYASAVTAHVSQAILDAGKAFCSLSTDMSNPTSNKIYQAIGYKFMGNQRRIKFEDRE